VVKKKGKTYIVEVKSGTSAIHLKNISTRRQLLEYDFVVENDGMFILDMENENMQLVEFQSKQERKDKVLRNVMMVIALIGIAIPYWELKVLFGFILLTVWKFPKTTIETLELLSLVKRKS
jgi:hypothetical protein